MLASGTTPGSRLAAARLVAEWLRSREFPGRLMEAVTRDRAFVMELVYGAVRQYRALEWYRRRLAPRRPKPDLHAVLLVGLYQVFFLDEVVPYALVNETVEAAKAVAGKGAAGLVNAVLRRAAGEISALRKAFAQQSEPVRLSHPDLLWKRWSNHAGEAAARSLCEWNNLRPDVTLRVNLAAVTLETFLRSLTEAGIAAPSHPFAPDRFVVLPRGIRVPDVPGYAEGWFAVQDPSTSAAVDLLNARPGECVLDACAAPGGKTLALAESMAGSGTLVAMDPSPERLEPLRENVKRLGARGVHIVPADLTRLSAARDRLAEVGLPDRYAAILLDVPCTNTGVIRRRADVRWNFSEARLRRVVERQRSILESAAALLEPGGRIVYSTCSLEPEENEQQVETWVERHPEFKPEQCRRLFPPESGTDGAFAALLTHSG